MTAWFVFAAIGLGSFAMRAAMVTALASRNLPPRFDVAMRFVGPAAVGALAATLTFTHAGAFRQPAVAELIAVVVAFLAVRRTGNMLHAIAVGLPTFWLLNSVIG
jgi:branched-subunit amino acid transport protein